MRKKSAMTPIHTVPVIIESQIFLRVYCGPDLRLDAPLHPRQALDLARDLLTLALSSELGA